MGNLTGKISECAMYHTDAYTLAVANGFDGTLEEWLASLKGAPGENGRDGAKGEAGATFTPSISEDGVLSWTNNKGLINPSPVSIKGEKGDSGSIETVQTTGESEAAVMSQKACTEAFKQKDKATLTAPNFTLYDVGDKGKVKLKANVTDSSLESFEVWVSNSAFYNGGYETGTNWGWQLYKQTKEFIPITATTMMSFSYRCPYGYTRILCYDADYNELAYVEVGTDTQEESFAYKDASDLLTVAPDTKYIKIVSTSEDGLGQPVLYDIKISDSKIITLTKAENFEKEAEIFYPVCDLQGEDAAYDSPSKIELTYTRDVYAYIDYLESRLAAVEAAVLYG